MHLLDQISVQINKYRLLGVNGNLCGN